MNDFLKNLKEGDDVIVELSGAIPYRKAKVLRITDEHIMIDGEMYFRKTGRIDKKLSKKTRLTGEIHEPSRKYPSLILQRENDLDVMEIIAMLRVFQCASVEHYDSMHLDDLYDTRYKI